MTTLFYDHYAELLYDRSSKCLNYFISAEAFYRNFNCSTKNDDFSCLKESEVLDINKYSFLMSLYIKENPEYLKQSIDSMLNQTVQADEIVIVKDGPLTKELNKILNQYQKKYLTKIKIIVSENNIGLGKALNLGLKHCENNLIARMDADDISLPDRCEKQLNKFNEDKDLSILGGYIYEFINPTQDNLKIRMIPSKDINIKKYLKKRNPFNHMTVMFKKNEVILAGNYIDWPWHEDYYLWIRMFESKCKFANLKEPLVMARVNKDTYKRRGGVKYFISHLGLQKYMLNKKIINYPEFVYNITMRFTLQILMPNKLREFLYNKIARSDAQRENY